MRRRLPEHGGDKPEARGEFLLYTAEDGRTRIDCRLDGQTLWLTQAQIAERFQTTPQNITLHLKAILADGDHHPLQRDTSRSRAPQISVCT